MTATPQNYDDWAWFYDRTLGPAYRDAKMAFLERTALADLQPGARVLDLCCGAGQMMAPLLERGFEVTGLDMSDDMLRCAARNAPGASLMKGDARDFALERPVDAILCASASLNHMEDIDELGRVFGCAHAALSAAGRFVFDVNHPAQMTRHWRGAPKAGEIHADYAWMITPRYDPDTRRGAFRVQMHRREAPAPQAGPALWRAVLNRPVMRRARFAVLGSFARRRPGWTHRQIDFPVVGHEVDAVLERLRATGFTAHVETLDGRRALDADSAACFVCSKAQP